MKLYELHRGDTFFIQEQPQQPPDIITEVELRRTYRLHNIDGMYSYVTDMDDNVYHFAAWTEVKKV